MGDVLAHCSVFLFQHPCPCPWICHWLLSDVSIQPCLQTSNCLMPGALTCCSRRTFPFPWEGGIHLQIPTKPPAETSPLMTTTPQCCLSVPCWLCKRTGPGGARRNFIKCQSSIHWWATCHRQSRSQEKVLQDQGLEKVTEAWLWQLKYLPSCGMLHGVGQFGPSSLGLCLMFLQFKEHLLSVCYMLKIGEKNGGPDVVAEGLYNFRFSNICQVSECPKEPLIFLTYFLLLISRGVYAPAGGFALHSCWSTMSLNWFLSPS